MDWGKDTLQERGQGLEGEGECRSKDTLYSLQSVVVRRLHLISHLDFEYFQNSSEFVQIISLYLTALVAWFLKGKAEQSLTTQNLAETFYEDVPPGLGAGLSAHGHLSDLLQAQAGFQDMKQVVGINKIAQLYCGMN